MTLTKQQIDQWGSDVDYWRKKYADLGLQYDTLVNQTSQPDCRTCTKYRDSFCTTEFEMLDCINGDQYKPAERVVLWRTEP